VGDRGGEGGEEVAVEVAKTIECMGYIAIAE
jgi:hypothetical protein